MKKNITIFIASFLSIPAVVLICVACAFLSAFIYNQKIETFKANVTNLNYYIESTYTDQLTRIESIISSPSLFNFLDNPNDETLRAEASSTIFDTFTIEDSVLEIDLVNLQGEVILSTDLNRLEPDQKETLVFQKVIETKSSYSSLTFYEHTPILKIGYPILENNNLIGVYIRYTPLNYINYFARNIKSEEENIYLVTDDKNGVIFESNGNIVIVDKENEETASEDIEQLDILLTEKSRSDEGSINFQLNNQNVIGYYQIIKGLDWVCMISQPRAIILYDLNLFQLITLLVAGLFIVIINFAVNRFFGKYVNIIQSFNNTFNNFFSGNESSRVPHVDQPEILTELSSNINQAFERIDQLEISKNKVSQQLEDVLTLDPVTKLLNNKAFYQEIDEKFGQNPNQLLIMFNTGVYDEINQTFGNSVTNRLLEIVAEVVKEIESENFHSARLAQDSFSIFVDSFENLNEINEKLNELRLRLQAITRIDDLEINLKPNITVVYRDEHLLGRSDWLRLATEVLNESSTKNGSFTIFDFTSLNEIIHDNPEFMDNILVNDDNNVFEGFSRSSGIKIKNNKNNQKKNENND